MSKDNNQQIANHVSFVTIFLNFALSIFKLIAGIIANSNAMISDAIHSASDVFSTFIVIIGIKLSTKEADKNHPYGHERLECVAAIILSVVLLITGLSIGIQALKQIIEKDYATLLIPKKLALIAALISILTKEGMYWYTRHYALMIDSSALMADAWHHRSDSLSSIGALIGIIFARMGYPVMDSVASLVIFFFIAKAAIDIFKDAMDKMVDHSCDDTVEQAIKDLVLKNEEVLGIDLLQTRIFGNKIYIDLEIRLDASYTLAKAHDIAEQIHKDIENTFPKVKHVMIHVNPAKI